MHRARINRHAEFARISDFGGHATDINRLLQLSAAFFVTTRRRRVRLGFISASRTACRPKSHTVSWAAARFARSFSMTQVGFFMSQRAPCLSGGEHAQSNASVQGIFLLTPPNRVGIHRPTSGDVLQGAAADCNSAGETHAWFDSRVAHHSPLGEWCWDKSLARKSDPPNTDRDACRLTFCAPRIWEIRTDGVRSSNRNQSGVL